MTFGGIELWAAALLFARVSAIVMLLPGLGEPAVPAPARLVVALMLSLSLAPVLAPQIAAVPPIMSSLLAALLFETLIGLMIGIGARIIFAAIATAGQIVGLETGLAFAQVSDPTMTQAGQIVAVFLSILGATLVLATDLHHLFIRGIADSYLVFQPGTAPDVGDASDYALNAVSTSFLIGVQIVAPLLVAGLVFRAGLGVLSRLIPTIQVFFVAMPLNVLGGFLVLALGLSTGMLIWLDRLAAFARDLA
jgi:flagellar biosynthetic protein FliR